MAPPPKFSNKYKSYLLKQKLRRRKERREAKKQKLLKLIRPYSKVLCQEMKKMREALRQKLKDERATTRTKIDAMKVFVFFTDPP